MKKSYLPLLTAFLFVSVALNAQTGVESIPAVTIKKIDGSSISTADFDNDGKPMIICIWASWCKPCHTELSTINDVYADWQEETGVKYIAVSVDDVRNTAKVGPFVESRGWEFEVYLDANSDFKRAMNVANPPYTFLIDGDRKIVWEHSSYVPGDEEELYEKLLELVKNGKLD